MTLADVLDGIERLSDHGDRLAALRDFTDELETDLDRVREMRRRSVRSLRADGWSWPDIATILRSSPQYAHKLATQKEEP